MFDTYTSCHGCPLRVAATRDTDDCHGSCEGYQARQEANGIERQAREALGATSTFVTREIWDKRTRQTGERRARRKRG